VNHARQELRASLENYRDIIKPARVSGVRDADALPSSFIRQHYTLHGLLRDEHASTENSR